MVIIMLFIVDILLSHGGEGGGECRLIERGAVDCMCVCINAFKGDPCTEECV